MTRWLGLAGGFAVLLRAATAHATCVELPNYACEIIPTYGDCKSPENDVWAPDTPFTYRIGCEGEGMQSPDLLVNGARMKAKHEPLRQCGRWSLWTLEEPLPAGATLALTPAEATKPLPASLAIVEGAAKLPRVDREPRRDFVCNAPPFDEAPPPTPVVPPPAGCGGCVVSPTTRASETAWLLLAGVVLAVRRSLKQRRA